MSDWNPNDPDAPRVIYDLGMWSFDQQAELAAELAEAEVPHGWDGAELYVPEDHEAAADSIITQVEARLGIVYDRSAEPPTDNPAAERVELTPGEATTEYDLEDWPERERDAAERALTRQGIPFRWEGSSLVVHTEDEDVVDSLLDMVENGEVGQLDDPDDGDDEDDRLPFEILSVFFLAGERLRRDPLDAGGLEQLLEAVDATEAERPPYGVDPRLWTRVCELADELTGALVDEDTPDEDLAMEVAEELHDLLRPYI
ncbi:MAG: hypothetical protein H6513_01210 [Acidimicrobiaceae bacterium]|nr:hypothetical protein [Ilumatobacter sp.]MCB9379288.1 hypothetical protein [Acidimicrobiaceae bacterium]